MTIPASVLQVVIPGKKWQDWFTVGTKKYLTDKGVIQVKYNCNVVGCGKSIVPTDLAVATRKPSHSDQLYLHYKKML